MLVHDKGLVLAIKETFERVLRPDMFALVVGARSAGISTKQLSQMALVHKRCENW
jgi:hypothetical protein